MTEEELSREWQVTYETRLGVLCSQGPSLEWMIDLAFDEAQEHVRKLRLESKNTS